MELLERVWQDWKVVEELGEGSFGKVYKIQREDIGGKFTAALKVITIPQNKSELNEILTEGYDRNSATEYFRGVVEELVKEFAMMERLKGHTNIVAYEDHKVVPHTDFIGWDILIRMELLTPMTEYMLEHTFTEEDVVKLGIDICKALEICEKDHIIHRDIKPENIFISKFGDFKLGDFGIARTAEKTASGMSRKGTYTYMAPEIYRGDAYNATVDLYSLGIVLYRLVNNYRVPFLPSAPQMISFHDKESAQERRMSGEIIPAPASCSKQLADVILKACAFQPSQRYKNPSEMRRALENISFASVKTESLVSVQPMKQEDLEMTVLSDSLMNEDVSKDTIIDDFIAEDSITEDFKNEDLLMEESVAEESVVEESVMENYEEEKTVSILDDSSEATALIYDTVLEQPNKEEIPAAVELEHIVENEKADKKNNIKTTDTITKKDLGNIYKPGIIMVVIGVIDIIIPEVVAELFYILDEIFYSIGIFYFLYEISAERIMGIILIILGIILCVIKRNKESNRKK